MTTNDGPSLLERFESRNERALARAISLVESGSSAGREFLREVRPRAGRARLVGITGSPGSGKSTLTDGLVTVARERGRTVAVVAVDPSSPYSGGAILGDRIRMTRHHQDAGVFIRSMATRGHLGGLAAATLQVVSVLDAYGFDDIFVETVGVGQSEVEIASVADTTLLVLTPGSGDGVQAVKAGVMEIADVFVINKADLPRAGALKREIRAALELAHPDEGDWWPSIVETIASRGEGLAELTEALDAHRAYLEESGRLRERRRNRVRFELGAILQEVTRQRLLGREAELLARVESGEWTPEDAVRSLFPD